ncbi:MAG: hypothetical protein P4L40_04185 [Terracidiphilus sp.]|nr:hypothetical protein [Terracidiphilus sp.]
MCLSPAQWSLGILLFVLLSGASPLTIAAASDWWFDLIYRRDYTQFWDMHERSVKFPAAAKGVCVCVIVCVCVCYCV